MLGHIRALASDEFEGRGMASAGERRTVDYLVGAFRRLGLKPGHPDGSYVQKVPFVGTRSRMEMTMELAGDPQVADPADPGQLDAAMFKGRAMTFYAQGDHKRAVAAQRGAAARLVLFEPGMFGVPTWKTRTSVFGLEDFDIRAADRKMSELGAGGDISPELAQRLFAASGLDLAALKQAARRKDFRPVPLNATDSFTIRQTLREIDSTTVVARIEGSDPQLRHEWVIYTAHWDHFGRDPTLAGDQVFNGALDNASGVAAMLEVAKAFARLCAA